MFVTPLWLNDHDCFGLGLSVSLLICYLSEGQSLSEVGFSVVLQGFVPNTACYNEWALNFESWKFRVAVEEAFPRNVLLTDDSKLHCSCLCKYVGNTARCNT